MRLKYHLSNFASGRGASFEETDSPTRRARPLTHLRTRHVCLWAVLGLLADAGFDTFGQPASGQLSVSGTPGAATQRAVVNFAQLPHQETGDDANPPPRPPPHPNVLDSPPLASSFSGFISDGYIPPDTHGAVGLNHLVASVNIRLRVQDRAGKILGTVSYADFWAPLATLDDVCCDHRVLYEPFDDRWIIVGQTSKDAPRPSALIGVSQTGDPMGRWNLYRIEVADIDPADQLWPDYPQIAFNKDWIVAQLRIFRSNVSTPFIRSQIYVFNKTNLYAGGPGLFTRFAQPNTTVNRVFAFPVMSFDHSLPTMFLLAQDVGPLRPEPTTDGTTNINTIAQIYTITGAVGSEVLTEGPTVTATNQWDFTPPGGFTTDQINRNFAPQLGTSQKVAVWIGTILGAVFRNGSLWAVHQVFLPAGGTPTRTAIQWWQLSPDGTILQRGMIDDPAGVNFYSWPSLSVNQFNDVLIGYSRFSSNQYASANYSFRYGTDPPNTLRSDSVFKAGEASYVNLLNGRNRWGDYSATVVDPLNDTDLWSIQEYAASPANTWGTWWGRVAPTAATLPLLLIDEPTVTEGDFGTTNVLFTVRLTHTNSQPVTVEFVTADLTAQAGTDYTVTNGILTFASGETNKIITVTVFGDLFEETNEAFQVTLNNPTNATLGIPFALGRIIDDDPVQISIADVSVIEGDLGMTNARFTIRLSKSYHLPVSVDFATADGTALAGSDYVATNGTLTFIPGQTVQTFAVTIIGDEIDETNETFVVALTNPMNAALALPQANATILDDDPLVVTISDVSVREGDSGTSNALFTVTLSKPYHLPVSVDFSTTNGSALAGADYAATNGTLTFAPGETTQIISVAVNGDLTDEASENFFLNLSNAVNVNLIDTQGKATILDDDPLVLLIPDISVLEGYNGTSEARFTVSLSKPMGVPVSLDFATANGTALAGSDYFSTNGTLTFLPGETNHIIVVAVIGDALDELNETFFVNLTNSLNVVLTDTQARATIVDDDDAMISVSDATVREGQTGQISATFTVSLSTMSTRTVSVRASTANVSATAGADYLAFSSLLVSFPSGTTNQTVVVQVLGDTVTEPNETFRVNLTGAVNGFITRAQGVGTILDDDFNIVAIKKFGPDLRVSFMTVAGWNYTVERTEDLNGTAVWTPVSGAEAVAGTGGVVNELDPIVGQPQRFYRVRLLP